MVGSSCEMKHIDGHIQERDGNPVTKIKAYFPVYIPVQVKNPIQDRPVMLHS